MGTEGGFPFIAFFDMDQVEGVLEVNDSERGTAGDVVDKIMSKWERITNFLGDGVKASIIDTKMKVASFSFDKEDGR